jgi:Helix-turn-helix domain
MLRIRFTLEDLARTRIAAGPDPRWEAMAGLRSPPAKAGRPDEPRWSSAGGDVEADRARRLRSFAEGGCVGMLAGFRPLLRWDPPMLTADGPGRHDLRLAGRGLLLVPVFSCGGTPIAVDDPDAGPVLVYPVDRNLAPPGAGPAVLAALLGDTRAAVLRAVAAGCSTTELARRAGTSLASASEHAAVLRRARLLVTQRLGGSVLHSLTPLGQALVTNA